MLYKDYHHNQIECVMIRLHSYIKGAQQISVFCIFEKEINKTKTILSARSGDCHIW